MEEDALMLSASEWRKNLPNLILFVLVDDQGLEVTGVGQGFDIFISKAGGIFATGNGAKTEIGFGWYSYECTAAEADTSGPVAVVVTAAPVIQQNLEYVVDDRVVSAIEFTYTVTSTAGNIPLEDVVVNIYSDNLATELVWVGSTDVFGVARDSYGYLPRLPLGAYYFWRYKSGYSFVNPDTEVVG